MKLLNLHIKDEFRSLHADFEVKFHQLTDKGIKAMESFQPFCFAGLNGSGKSNVLEALGAIFYHLEFCVAKFRPRSFEEHFKRTESKPDAYTLEYLIGQHDSKPYALYYFDKVTIEKKKGEEPKLFIQHYPFDETVERKEISLKSSENNDIVAEGKSYLPDLVVGYSSGENEILSLPFIKNRLVNFDKYREDFRQQIRYEEPETSLIYIDEGMSQAVLLAILLFEDEATLAPLRTKEIGLGVVALESFTMNLNNQNLIFDDEDKNMSTPILGHIGDVIADLKKCATSWYEHKVNNVEGLSSVLSIDFHVDEATKAAFKAHFSTPFELFRFFQVLYELNANIVSDEIKEEVYDSKGFYTKSKLPVAAPRDSVFHFLDFKISKIDAGKTEPRSSLLREFSDGEHQFLHTIGICLMLKARRSILLLDEPETHFNPAWRAKFVKILNDSITSGTPKNLPNGGFNVHLLKDVIVTSHSPFIISDCMPSNVIFFKRNSDTQKVEAKSAREIEFNTYGTSVEIILDELFDYNQTIGDWSNEELLKISFDSIQSKADVDKLKKRLNKLLGESIEKDLVLAKLNRLKLDD